MKNYFTIIMFFLLFGCGGEETVASGDNFSGDPNCKEEYGYYKEGCLVSDEDQQNINFELCAGTDEFLASHNYTNLSDIKGKVILLEFSATW